MPKHQVLIKRDKDFDYVCTKLDCIRVTSIMINKGVVNSSKYWIFEQNKGIPVSYFREPRVLIRVPSTQFHYVALAPLSI